LTVLVIQVSPTEKLPRQRQKANYFHYFHETRRSFIAAARVRENWFLVALILAACCRTGVGAVQWQVLAVF